MQEWNSFYAFPETEFTEEDFKVMNHWTSTSMAKTNFQTRRVLVVRFLRGVVGGGKEEEDRADEVKGGEGREGIVGKVMLVDGEVKRNDAVKTRVVRVCKTEKGRIEVLRGEFGIELTGEEREGIKGRNVELRG
ncbi:N-terminal acetyltransferase [Cadophora gregata]|uniref:N-terminal acetyltransferase n=1 Tax=Cadophora gregata TaxID=51156 RepID=UPI0026DC1289|nr:N-terminal acetyltransferase [Cadophora gregata]KAK0125903.1 N-terminal acetyltransferase [Cadophora gregata]